MKDILHGTPIWVFVLLSYLIFIGIKSLKPQTINLKKLFLLPCGLLIWSFCSLDFPGALHFCTWLTFLALGLGFGWRLAQSIQIRLDSNKKEIELPGSPITLILILSIFAVKYFFGFTRGAHLPLADAPFFPFLELASSGIISGLFLGRMISFWRKAFL